MGLTLERNQLVGGNAMVRTSTLGILAVMSIDTYRAIDKWMSKSQQMRWDPQSAHQLLQVRVRVIDSLLRDDFARSYPGLPTNESSMVVMA